MNRNSLIKGKRSAKSIAISVVIHAFLIAALASVTFHYATTPSAAHQPIKTEHVEFVRVMPSAAPSSAAASKGPPPPRVKSMLPPPPSPIVAPNLMPVGVPKVSPVPPSPGVTNGTPGGTGVIAGPPTVGIVTIPDPRLPLGPQAMGTMPRSGKFMIDSAIAEVYKAYAAAIADSMAHPKRAPGDWTWGNDSSKWGWDPNGFHLGKFTIPNALLAVIKSNIPLSGENMGSVVQGHLQSTMDRDVREHMQGLQGLDEDDFNSMIKRMRANADAQHAEQQRRTLAHQDSATVGSSRGNGGGR